MQLLQTTSRIRSLARSGLIKVAREVFDEMPERDTVAWNAMLTGYAQLGLPREALLLFFHMRACGVRHDEFTLTSVLSASSFARDLDAGRKLHATVISSGFNTSLPVCNSLIDLYAKCSCSSEAASVFKEMDMRNAISWCSLLFAYALEGDVKKADQIFRDMPVHKTTVAWNILIWGYSQIGDVRNCIDRFREMSYLGVRGDLWTFSHVITACSLVGSSYLGCILHASTIRNGLMSSTVIGNIFIDFYAKVGLLADATKIFNSLEVQTPVSWNAVIDACMRAGNTQEALSFFLKAPEKNVAMWTSLVGGYARAGDGEEALSSFVSMTKNGLRPDEFTYGVVLLACAGSSLLGFGRMVHGNVIHSGFNLNIYVSNGLINMYIKCGDLSSSSLLFAEIQHKDIISWNAMLFGYTLHGRASDALFMYEDMLAHGFTPDKVTYIGLLMACSHAGLVEQGWKLFETMTSIHGLLPDADHLTCIINLLGRAGYVREAKMILKEYTMLADWNVADSCEALLGACVLHENPEIGKEAGENLLCSFPNNDAGYVMLSNMFCASGQWAKAEKVRNAMLELGVKKMPGCSWIEVKNEVTVFLSADEGDMLCASRYRGRWR